MGIVFSHTHRILLMLTNGHVELSIRIPASFRAQEVNFFFPLLFIQFLSFSLSAQGVHCMLNKYNGKREKREKKNRKCGFDALRCAYGRRHFSSAVSIIFIHIIPFLASVWFVWLLHRFSRLLLISICPLPFRMSVYAHDRVHRYPNTIPKRTSKTKNENNTKV